MKRCWPRRRTRLLLALLAGLPPATSWAATDWQFGRGKWTGGLGLSYEQTNQSSSTDSGSYSATGHRLREAFIVQGTDLYVLDRRLVNASLGLQLNLNQGDFSSSYGATRLNNISYDEQVLGYNLDASILEQKPYPMRLYANRNQTESVQSYGGRTTGVNENRGFTLQLKENSFLQNWGGPWFSANLAANQQTNQSTTSYFGRVIRNDQDLRTLDISANKGFTTSDLKFRYLAFEQSNPVLGLGGQVPGQNNPLLGRLSNQTQSAYLLYDRDFGPGLNHNTTSSLQYTTNSGLADSNSLALNETVFLNHYSNLSTRYNYGLTRNEAASVVTTEQTGSFNLSHQLYENLTTSLNLNGTHLALPYGTRTSYGGQFSQSYSHNLPGSGSLGLNWALGDTRYSNDLKVGIINLIGESHQAPAELEPGFLLGQSFVIDRSIQVFNVQSGVRELLSEVSDGDGAGGYRVVREGNRTRIEPVYVYLGLAIDPNAPVKPGDKLEVDYSYRVDASLTSDRRQVAYGLRLDYGWIGGAYQHLQSSDRALSGDALFLNDTRDDNVSLYLRGAWQGYQTSATLSHARSISSNQAVEEQTDTTRLALQGSGRVFNMDGQASASFERYRARDLGYDQSMLMATLFWRPQDNWDMTFGAVASELQYLQPERQTTDLSARASLNWNPQGGWLHTAFTEARTRSDSLTGDQTFLRMGARTRKKWGKLTLSAGVSLDYQVIGVYRANSQSFDVSIGRAFW